ncbi:SDR family NAD(P)-dependent oxidoreductase [Microlunatus elymi]|nr:SDR family oxidoreductase [Microlunatus elymi]
MRTAVVTGGGTGIGRAIAKRLSADGTRVIIVGRRKDVLADAAAEINKSHGDELVEYRAADLADPDQVDELAGVITAECGVDFLINNAGGDVGFGHRTETLSDLADKYRTDFTANLITTMLITEALLPAITRPGGRIVMITSGAGLRGSGSYGVAKAAVHGYMWDLTNRLAAQQVTANAIAPSFVPDTEFWDGRRDPADAATRVSRIPMNRPGTPSEVAEAVAYLCNAEAGWTTGQILQLNGGALLGHG